VLLQNIDCTGASTCRALDYLRQGIHLRGYAQKQPKQEYKREAFELFGQLLDIVKNEVTRIADDGASAVQLSSWVRRPSTWSSARAHHQRHLHRTHRNRRGRNHFRIRLPAPRPTATAKACRAWGATIPAPAAVAKNTSNATAS
jgi:preprotein translocase subunit SecA